MAEFCKCGSLMIDGNCSNKKCSNKEIKSSPAKIKKTAATKTEVVKTTTKNTRVPRASKCITYKIGELPPDEK